MLSHTLPCGAVRRWAWFFLLSAAHVGLAAWTFVGPPIVGKWAAGVFTMIDQFKEGKGELSLAASYAHSCVCAPLAQQLCE